MDLWNGFAFPFGSGVDPDHINDPGIDSITPLRCLSASLLETHNFYISAFSYFLTVIAERASAAAFASGRPAAGDGCVRFRHVDHFAAVWALKSKNSTRRGPKTGKTESAHSRFESAH